MDNVDGNHQVAQDLSSRELRSSSHGESSESVDCSNTNQSNSSPRPPAITKRMARGAHLVKAIGAVGGQVTDSPDASSTSSNSGSSNSPNVSDGLTHMQRSAKEAEKLGSIINKLKRRARDSQDDPPAKTMGRPRTRSRSQSTGQPPLEIRPKPPSQLQSQPQPHPQPRLNPIARTPFQPVPVPLPPPQMQFPPEPSVPFDQPLRIETTPPYRPNLYQPQPALPIQLPPAHLPQPRMNFYPYLPSQPQPAHQSQHPLLQQPQPAHQNYTSIPFIPQLAPPQAHQPLYHLLSTPYGMSQFHSHQTRLPMHMQYPPQPPPRFIPPQNDLLQIYQQPRPSSQSQSNPQRPQLQAKVPPQSQQPSQGQPEPQFDHEPRPVKTAPQAHQKVQNLPPLPAPTQPASQPPSYGVPTDPKAILEWQYQVHIETMKRQEENRKNLDELRQAQAQEMLRQMSTQDLNGNFRPGGLIHIPPHTPPQIQHFLPASTVSGPIDYKPQFNPRIRPQLDNRNESPSQAKRRAPSNQPDQVRSSETPIRHHTGTLFSPNVPIPVEVLEQGARQALTPQPTHQQSSPIELPTSLPMNIQRPIPHSSNSMRPVDRTRFQMPQQQRVNRVPQVRQVVVPFRREQPVIINGNQNSNPNQNHNQNLSQQDLQRQALINQHQQLVNALDRLAQSNQNRNGDGTQDEGHYMNGGGNTNGRVNGYSNGYPNGHPNSDANGATRVNGQSNVIVDAQNSNSPNQRMQVDNLNKSGDEQVEMQFHGHHASPIEHLNNGNSNRSHSHSSSPHGTPVPVDQSSPRIQQTNDQVQRVGPMLSGQSSPMVSLPRNNDKPDLMNGFSNALANGYSNGHMNGNAGTSTASYPINYQQNETGSEVVNVANNQIDDQSSEHSLDQILEVIQNQESSSSEDSASDSATSTV